MVNLTYHSTEFGSILTLYNLRNLVQAKRVKCTLLVYRGTDFAPNLFDFYCCHFRILYPLNTFSILIPRVLATVYASRIWLNA